MIIKIILLSIAALCWAVCSHYTFQNTEKKPYSFFGIDSWKRKYKRSSISNDRYYPMPATNPNLYYRLFKIKYIERFPLSATALVFLTDGYHLMQWVMIKCIIGAITLEPVQFFTLWAVWLVVFNVVYVKLKK